MAKLWFDKSMVDGELEFSPEPLADYAPRGAILDAGAQYVDLIERACWRLGYPADIIPLDTPYEDIKDKYDWYIISGGPGNSHSEDAPMPDEALWQTDKGILGICYGEHAMATAFGGTVEAGVKREDGVVKTTVDTEHPLFHRTKAEVDALFTHGDFVTEVPEGFEVIGEHELKLDDGTIQRVISAMARGKLVATQFHPEVFDDTPQGYDIFGAFFEEICELLPDEELLRVQTAEDYEQRKAAIAEQVGDRHVIGFVSGGIDSVVAACLAREVISPDKLHLYYFDNGFMRDEDDSVIETLQQIGINVQAIDATEFFEQATIEINGTTYGPLVDVTDPAIKRKIIGQAFVKLKDIVAGQLNLDTDEVMLLQGTNAADRIESGHSKGGQETAQIVEHHNQVQGIKDLEKAGRLSEPINDIHKDEIRRLAEYMGLLEEVVWRHPFPGPGNAIRILGAKPDDYELPAAELDQSLQEYMQHHAFGKAFAGQLLPTRSGGVGGDAQSYILPVALQGEPNWDTLAQLAQDIPSAFRDHVNRVIYALGDAPIQELSVTETSLRRPERAQLRHVDRIVFEEMRARGLMREISQLPVVLLPLSFGTTGERSIVLRPVKTSTFLTARAVTGQHIDPSFFFHTADRILNEVRGISQVFLEVTGKPPGRTEWE